MSCQPLEDWVEASFEVLKTVLKANKGQEFSFFLRNNGVDAPQTVEIGSPLTSVNFRQIYPVTAQACVLGQVIPELEGTDLTEGRSLDWQRQIVALFERIRNVAQSDIDSRLSYSISHNRILVMEEPSSLHDEDLYPADNTLRPNNRPAFLGTLVTFACE